jgi:hypothetical protein
VGQAFYLREVRRPMTELLRGVDWDSLRLSKLGWAGLQDSALARSVPPRLSLSLLKAAVM